MGQRVGAGGVTGIDYGKIRVYSSQDDLGKCLEVFNKLMKEHKYPEMDSISGLDLPLPTDDDLQVQDKDEEELPEEKKPVVEIIDEKTIEEIGKEIGADESPWFKALRKRNMLEGQDGSEEQ